jgi:hypothetical protein
MAFEILMQNPVEKKIKDSYSESYPGLLSPGFVI